MNRSRQRSVHMGTARHAAAGCAADAPELAESLPTVRRHVTPAWPGVAGAPALWAYADRDHHGVVSAGRQRSGPQRAADRRASGGAASRGPCGGATAVLDRGRGDGAGEQAAWWWLRRIHNAADRTLAPSTAAATALYAHGIRRVWLWRRGVDTVRFDPAHRSEALRRALAPGGEVIVGYIGRLAAEKRVELLAETTRLPGVRVVVVGDGPAAAAVRRALPGALFLGPRHGAQLARIYASLDIFVHTGPYETFGQTVQEALASGVPVVAPAAGGPLDLVTPGQTGSLVAPHDGRAIAAAVAELAGSPQRRAGYARTARQVVAHRTWAAVGDELIAHYVAAVSGDHAAETARVPA